MKVSVVTLPRNNQHPVVVVDNPPYNVVGHINRNYFLRRRKRDENHGMLIEVFVHACWTNKVCEHYYDE